MVRTVASMKDLEKRLEELEEIQGRQLTELKLSAIGIVESFSPSNMLKSVLQDIAHSSSLRSTAINTAIGMGAGFLGKKLFVGKSGNLFKKITGTALQFLVTNFVRKRIPVNGEDHKAN